MRLKQFLIFYLFLSSLSGCWLFGDQDTTHIHLTKNIYLSLFGNEENQFLINNIKKNYKAWEGNVLIERFVYAVGYTKDFIIAKQVEIGQPTSGTSEQPIYHIIDARTETLVYTFSN